MDSQFDALMGIDTTVEYLRVLIDEHLDGVYGWTSPCERNGLWEWSPEQAYRGIRIGKYRRGGLTENLPSYLAILRFNGEPIRVRRTAFQNLKRLLTRSYGNGTNPVTR
ncbi:MAG: hypothetical protein F4246_12235 [Rhodothermaceae bacterium]|nr:hypothetical protein [Rhodothermaceae bacterium]MYJ57299.1 hypothetical protein [Rhodothermaceae bacterium]